MKKLFLFSFLLFSLRPVCGQNGIQNVERDFINYSKLISEKKIDLALEYLNPKLFEIFPKDQLKYLMESVYKMPNIECRIAIPTINKISQVKRVDNIDYMKLNILSPIEIKFTDINTDERLITNMIASFEAKFGKESVIYDKETGFFKINANKEIVASSTDNQENWKFVTVDDPRMKTLLEKIVPIEFLN